MIPILNLMSILNMRRLLPHLAVHREQATSIQGSFSQLLPGVVIWVGRHNNINLSHEGWVLMQARKMTREGCTESCHGSGVRLLQLSTFNMSLQTSPR